MSPASPLHITELIESRKKYSSTDIARPIPIPWAKPRKVHASAVPATVIHSFQTIELLVCQRASMIRSRPMDNTSADASIVGT
jgi:hypothetical protein